MRLMVKMISAIAFTGWAVGAFVYHQGGIFHFSLVIAVACFILAFAGGDNLFRYDDAD